MEFSLKTKFDFAVPYSVSKAAVDMVTAKYAARFKDENLLFVSISPGVINTRPDLRAYSYSCISFILSGTYINICVYS